MSLTKPDGTYTRGPVNTLDYLLECVLPVIGTEYVEPPNGWTWDRGADLLKEGILNSAVADLTLGRASGVDGITPSMLKEGWSKLARIECALDA